MEIINLKSDQPLQYKITDIKQAVRDENRVNVFVNEKYSFSLDIAQLVDFKLKIGLALTEDDIQTYKRASAFGKLYQRTLEWVLTRPHSVQETRDHIYLYLSRSKARKKSYELKHQTEKRKPVQEKEEIQLTTEEINSIIERLETKDYLNDTKFAQYYVENRFVKKGISAKRLKMELLKKGISQTIVDEVLSGNERNDVEEIKKIITKKRSRYDDVKLTNYLLRQGFDYETVRNLVQDSSGTD